MTGVGCIETVGIWSKKHVHKGLFPIEGKQTQTITNTTLKIQKKNV